MNTIAPYARAAHEWLAKYAGFFYNGDDPTANITVGFDKIGEPATEQSSYRQFVLVESATIDALQGTSIKVYADGEYAATGGKHGFGDFIDPGCRSGAEGTTNVDEFKEVLKDFAEDWIDCEVRDGYLANREEVGL